MKKIYKTFTFYFILLSIIIVILNILKKDDMNILLIGLNPILNLLDDSKIFCDFMNSNNYLWYISNLLTNTFYGLILDFIKLKSRRIK